VLGTKHNCCRRIWTPRRLSCSRALPWQGAASWWSWGLPAPHSAGACSRWDGRLLGCCMIRADVSPRPRLTCAPLQDVVMSCATPPVPSSAALQQQRAQQAAPPEELPVAREALAAGEHSTPIHTSLDLGSHVCHTWLLPCCGRPQSPVPPLDRCMSTPLHLRCPPCR
jgi:hypothetical protein